MPHLPSTLKEFSPSDVRILDPYYISITEKDVAFLNAFNADKLLYNFRLTAGLPQKNAKAPYSGWENMRIGGHTLGHYLAAAAQAVARGYGGTAGSDGFTLEGRLDYLLAGLDQCQQALGTGFIFGATMADPSKPELQFDLVESDNARDTWVPWYTFHKLMNGLVESWKQAGKRTALTVAERFAEWAYRRTSRWTPETQARVLSIEYGGTNDCLYELYSCALADGYENAGHILEAAHAFDELPLFQAVLEAAGAEAAKTTAEGSTPQKDALNNRHANTTIPKYVGCMNRYLTLGEDAAEYLKYAEAFWETVVNHHTYITGGNSECEHFGKADVLDAERSNTNCETCNAHNMLKLTRMLFQATGKRRYADFYENTFLNSIMASVNADTGMTLYFQPMATGLFKTYCNPDPDRNFFWCCTGTGLENFTKLGDSFYFHTDDTLYVNMFISSSVHWERYGLTLTQQADIPDTDEVRFTVTRSVPVAVTAIHQASNGETACRNTSPATIAFRMPDWLSGKAFVTLNGSPCRDACIRDGYLFITRPWQDGDTITLTLPARITSHTLPDNKGSTFAFKYGPLVLAAELGSERKYLYQIGVLCDVAGNKIVRGQEMTLTGNYGGTSGLRTLPAETLLVRGGSVSRFMDEIDSHFQRTDGTLTFRLNDTNWPDGLVFTPYYRITDQRYGIYWLFTDSADQVPEEDSALNSDDFTELQGIGVGYGMQTEGNADTFPYLEETGSGSLNDPHQMTRCAKADGGFSYMMRVRPEAQNFLECTFLAEDAGKTLRISSDGREIARLTLDAPPCSPSQASGAGTGTAETYSRRFQIPADVLAKAVPCTATGSLTTAGTPDQAAPDGDLPAVRISFQSLDDGPSARIVAPLRTICRIS